MDVNINIGQVIVWLVIGALAGTLAARVVGRQRRGFGVVTNTIIGMIGAVIGAFVFNLLDIGPWFSDIVITLDDVIQAFIGSLLLLAVVSFIRR